MHTQLASPQASIVKCVNVCYHKRQSALHYLHYSYFILSHHGICDLHTLCSAFHEHISTVLLLNGSYSTKKSSNSTALTLYAYLFAVEAVTLFQHCPPTIFMDCHQQTTKQGYFILPFLFWYFSSGTCFVLLSHSWTILVLTRHSG